MKKTIIACVIAIMISTVFISCDSKKKSKSDFEKGLDKAADTVVDVGHDIEKGAKNAVDTIVTFGHDVEKDIKKAVK